MARQERGPEFPFESDRKGHLLEVLVIVAIVLALLFVIAWPRFC